MLIYDTSRVQKIHFIQDGLVEQFWGKEFVFFPQSMPIKIGREVGVEKRSGLGSKRETER